MAAVPMPISHNRDYTLADHTGNQADYLEMEFLFDPRRRMVNYQNPRLTVAQDENGASLLAPAAGEPPRFNFGPYLSPYGFQSHLVLSYPANVGKTLARLEGTVTVRVATQSQTLNIPDLAKAV